MSNRAIVVSMLLAVAAFACAKKTKAVASESASSEDFECKKRHAEYTLKGSFAAPELGVILDCGDRGPSITRWVLRDSQGNEKKDARSISGSAFDAAWSKISAAGWEQLGDCKNPAAKDDDPVYLFSVSDDTNSVDLMCQGTKIPFPYDALFEELDELARTELNR